MDSKFFKKFFLAGSAVFAVATVFLQILWLIILSDKLDALEIGFPSYRLLMVALYSYMLSFAFTFSRLENFTGWIRITVNYILVTSGFFVCIYMPVAQEQAEPAGPFIVIALIAAFSVIYFLCYGIYKLTLTVKDKRSYERSKKGIPEKSSNRTKKNAKKEEYAPMFNKTK